MDSSATASRLRHLGYLLAVAVGTLVLDSMAVAYLWGKGVNFAIQDRVTPGTDGFLIEPMLAGYKWLLGAVLTANLGLLCYLWAKRRHRLALAVATGAVLPMAYLVNILLRA